MKTERLDPQTWAEFEAQHETAEPETEQVKDRVLLEYLSKRIRSNEAYLGYVPSMEIHDYHMVLAGQFKIIPTYGVYQFNVHHIFSNLKFQRVGWYQIVNLLKGLKAAA